LALPYFLTSVRWQDIAAPIVAALVLPALHRLGEKWPLDREAGEVSYTLYLLHPVSGLMMAMLIKGIPIWPRTLILTAGSLAAATGLWWLVERPMTRLRRHLAA
jgi:peptidoglycan/LPS O-acetylase OafA/YrhL